MNILFRIGMNTYFVLASVVAWPETSWEFQKVLQMKSINLLLWGFHLLFSFTRLITLNL